MTPLRGLALALAVLAFAGCATVTPVAVSRPATADVAFDAAGRLSARHGSEGAAVNFNWVHARDADQFDLATPLGQVAARLSGDASGVRVERPGQDPEAYPDWNALTRAVLGVAIPVDGLATWIQGVPSPRAGFDLERDAAGRPLVLRQQGWEIVYAYADDAARQPLRLVMRYPDSEPIEVRIVVDRFTPDAAPPPGAFRP